LLRVCQVAFLRMTLRCKSASRTAPLAGCGRAQSPSVRCTVCRSASSARKAGFTGAKSSRTRSSGRRWISLRALWSAELMAFTPSRCEDRVASRGNARGVRQHIRRFARRHSRRPGCGAKRRGRGLSGVRCRSRNGPGCAGRHNLVEESRTVDPDLIKLGIFWPGLRLKE
jgi:hypothetical protein